jgi:hypothetical protein
MNIIKDALGLAPHKISLLQAIRESLAYRKGFRRSTDEKFVAGVRGIIEYLIGWYKF